MHHRLTDAARKKLCKEEKKIRKGAEENLAKPNHPTKRGFTFCEVKNVGI